MDTEKEKNNQTLPPLRHILPRVSFGPPKRNPEIGQRQAQRAPAACLEGPPRELRHRRRILVDRVGAPPGRNPKGPRRKETTSWMVYTRFLRGLAVFPKSIRSIEEASVGDKVIGVVENRWVSLVVD